MGYLVNLFFQHLFNISEKPLQTGLQDTTTSSGLEPGIHRTKVSLRLAAAHPVMPGVTGAPNDACTGQAVPLLGNEAQFGRLLIEMSPLHCWSDLGNIPAPLSSQWVSVAATIQNVQHGG